MKNVLAILLLVLQLKSIAHTFTNTSRNTSKFIFFQNCNVQCQQISIIQNHSLNVLRENHKYVISSYK